MNASAKGRSAVRRGKEAERKFVAWMRANGFPTIERRLSGAAGDTGDTTGHPGLVFEVKDRSKLALAAWLDQLEDEMENGNAEAGAVIFKRRGRGDPGDWYALLPTHVLVKLLRASGWGDPLPDTTNQVNQWKANRSDNRPTNS